MEEKGEGEQTRGGRKDLLDAQTVAMATATSKAEQRGRTPRGQKSTDGQGEIAATPHPTSNRRGEDQPCDQERTNPA
jgi:hypothetical protein